MRPSGEPLYLQIAKTLREEIEKNHKPGDKLESEGKIAERFNVNRHTMRRAIDELVNQGSLERRRGLGVFVFGRPLQYPLHAETRVTTNFQQMGVKGERSFFKRHVLPASREVAEYLQIPQGRMVAVLESLVLVDGFPFCLSTHYFVHEAHKQIYDTFESGSLHAFITRTYDIQLKRKMSMVTALLPSNEDAAFLRISLNQPILQIRSVNINSNTKEPVEYVITRCRADRVDLTLDF